MSPAGSAELTNDNLTLAIARIIHEDCPAGAAPLEDDETEEMGEEDLQIDWKNFLHGNTWLKTSKPWLNRCLPQFVPAHFS